MEKSKNVNIRDIMFGMVVSDIIFFVMIGSLIMTDNSANIPVFAILISAISAIATVVAIVMEPIGDGMRITNIVEQEHIPGETITVTKATLKAPFSEFDSDFPAKIYYRFSNGETYDFTVSTLKSCYGEGSIAQKCGYYVTTLKTKDGQTLKLTTPNRLKIKDKLEIPIRQYEPKIEWLLIEPYGKTMK